MDINFLGKTILITGATGNLGTQLVEDYYLSGASTLILFDVAKKEKELQQLASKYSNKINVRWFCVDNTKVDEIKTAVEKLKKENLSVDILVNNAGINILSKTNDLDESIWDQVIDINLKGSFFLTKLIGHSSLIENKGNVVFISSQHGVVGNNMRTAYCSSKAGLLGLVRALTAEWSVYGVRINAVSPTFILNKSNEAYLMGAREKKQYLNKIPLYKYATVSDVSNAVLFLTSDKASMITGHNLIVDGGYTSV